jgi:hypothetical protein
MPIRNAARYFLWMVLLIVGSAEALIILGYLIVLVTQGPRGIVGHFEHIALSGHWFPKTPEESSRIFWASAGPILAAEFGGLLVVFGAWRLLKRLPPQRDRDGRPSVVRT